MRNNNSNDKDKPMSLNSEGTTTGRVGCLLPAVGNKPKAGNIKTAVDFTTLSLIFLSGAGGVGKTKVAQALKTRGEDLGYKVHVTQSTTRASYAKMGIRDEAQARILIAEDKLALQNRIFYDYCENLLQTIADSIQQKSDVLVIDRSPYDHVSYLFNALPNLSLPFIEERLAEANHVMTEALALGDLRVAMCPFVWFFAYPTAWAKDPVDKIADGFRNAPAAKNYIWSLSLQQMLRHQLGKVIYKEFAAYNSATPEQRAHQILVACGQGV